jgi:hypothetical protein
VFIPLRKIRNHFLAKSLLICTLQNNEILILYQFNRNKNSNFTSDTLYKIIRRVGKFYSDQHSYPNAINSYGRLKNLLISNGSNVRSDNIIVNISKIYTIEFNEYHEVMNDIMIFTIQDEKNDRLNNSINSTSLYIPGRADMKSE